MDGGQVLGGGLADDVVCAAEGVRQFGAVLGAQLRELGTPDGRKRKSDVPP